MKTADQKRYIADVRTGFAGIAACGFVLIAVFVGSFAAWGSTAPISGAVVATGVVAAAGQNQNIQHLEGGIVSEILTGEGRQVSRGDALLKLDPTPAIARRNRLRNKLIGLEAKTARLVAERDLDEKVFFSPDLRDRAAAEGLTGLLEEQRKEFEARLSRHRQEAFILTQRLEALGEQRGGLHSQQNALQRQLAVVEEEAGRKQRLLDQGLTSRDELTALVRSQADLVGQIGQITSSELASRMQAAEAREQIAKLDTKRVETALTELNAVRLEQSDVMEQLSEARDVLSRTTVRSPSDGIVVKMAVNAVGGVVEPAKPILELLPTSEKPIVDARVAPQDIDAIYRGQTARLRFSALNARTTPTVEAEIVYISADRLTDPQNDEAYYTVRLALSDRMPMVIKTDDIDPGMPVEVFIATEDRTFFEYLVKPIEDSFNRAFTEN